MADNTSDWKEEKDQQGFPTTESKATDPKESKNKCLYVKNIPKDVDRFEAKRHLTSMSRQYGSVERVYMGDAGTTWAMIFMDSHREAVAALRGLDKRFYKGQSLHVMWGHYKEEREAKNGSSEEENDEKIPPPPPSNGKKAPVLSSPSWADEDPNPPPSNGKKNDKSYKAALKNASPESFENGEPKPFVETQTPAKPKQPESPPPPPKPETPHNDKNPPGLVHLSPFPGFPQNQNPFALVPRLPVEPMLRVQVSAQNGSSFAFMTEITYDQWQNALFPLLNGLQDHNRRNFMFNQH